MESFQIFHVLSKLVSSESIKQKTRDLSLIQVKGGGGGVSVGCYCVGVGCGMLLCEYWLILISSPMGVSRKHSREGGKCGVEGGWCGGSGVEGGKCRVEGGRVVWREGSVEGRKCGVEGGRCGGGVWNGGWEVCRREVWCGWREVWEPICGNNTGCIDVWVMCLWSEDN